MKLMFAYGSNGPNQTAERLERDIEYCPAFVEDFGRVFRGYSRNWGGGTASIVKMPGKTVYGLAIPVDEDDLEIMDMYEGVRAGKYKRQIVKGWAACDEDEFEPVELVYYKATSRQFNPPTEDYLEAVAETISSGWGEVELEDIPIR